MSPSIRSITLAALALCGLALNHATAVAGQPYNPTRIVQEMRQKYGNGSTDYQLVIGAHRGVYKGISGCPENSTCSIANTYNKDIEVIELDIKTSANGTPWIFHDRNIGRVTNYGGSTQYNPYLNTGPNPTIDSLSDSTLSSLNLKDSIRSGTSAGSITGYRPMTLARALRVIKTHYPHMAVLLDVRSAADAAASDRVVQAHGMTGWVAIKGNVSFVRGQNFNSLVVPVVGAGDLDTLAATSPSDTPQNAVNKFIDSLFLYGNVVYVEVRMKDRWGPVAGTYEHQAAIRGTGSFQPIPDHAGLYYRANGQCCQALDETLATTRNFGNETRDDRENDSYHTNYFRTTLTDEPESLAGYARSQGRRNNSAYY